MKKAIILFVTIIFGFGLLLYVFNDWIARQVFQLALSRLTGFETKIGQFEFDLGKGKVNVQDMVIYNPAGFHKEVFTRIPEFSLAINLPAVITQGKVHVREAKLYIQELNIEKKGEGVSNLKFLSSVAKKKPKEIQKRETAPPATFRKPAYSPFRLDRLELTVRNLSYYDYSWRIPRKVDADLRIEKEVFEGIQDPRSIIYIILVRVIRSGALINVPASALENLGLDPIRIESTLISTMTKGREFLQLSPAQLARGAEAVLKETLGNTKGFLSRSEQSAGGTLNNLLGAIETQLPSGQKSAQETGQ